MPNLLEKASLILTPTAYSDGSLHVIKPTDVSGDFTFARNSNKTITNEQGNLEVILPNQPAIDFSSGCGKIGLEGSATNLKLFSNEINGINGGSTIANDGISPDGTQNATKLIFGSSNNDGASLGITTLVGSSTNYTLSFYAKKVVGNGGFNVRIDFDDQALVISTPFTTTDDWLRYEMTFTTNSGTSSISPNSRIRALSGNYNGEVLFYGFQLEEGTKATSYIPTSGSISTRVADTLTNGGSTTSINSVEGVFFAEMKAFDDTSFQKCISLNDGTRNNSIGIYINQGTIEAKLRINNIDQTPFTHTPTDVTAFNKIAFKYKSGDFALWVNGVEVVTATYVDVFAPNTLTRFDFNDGAIYPFIGEVNQVVLFKEILTDTQLTQLTTI